MSDPGKEDLSSKTEEVLSRCEKPEDRGNFLDSPIDPLLPWSATNQGNLPPEMSNRAHGDESKYHVHAFLHPHLPPLNQFPLSHMEALCSVMRHTARS